MTVSLPPAVVVCAVVDGCLGGADIGKHTHYGREIGRETLFLLLEAGLVYRPASRFSAEAWMSFIDDHNGGTYSHWSANAFAAADSVAGADKALAMHTVLFAHQPSETSAAGLSDAQILDYAAQRRITDPAFVKAVKDMTYKGWVSQVADYASKAGVTGTPTFYLNGRQISLDQLVNTSTQQFDPTKFTALVTAAS